MSFYITIGYAYVIYLIDNYIHSLLAVEPSEGEALYELLVQYSLANSFSIGLSSEGEHMIILNPFKLIYYVIITSPSSLSNSRIYTLLFHIQYHLPDIESHCTLSNLKDYIGFNDLLN